MGYDWSLDGEKPGNVRLRHQEAIAERNKKQFERDCIAFFTERNCKLD